jgi:hypothetical protein
MIVMLFGDVELLGPFSRLDELEDQPGLFVILCYENVTRMSLPFIRGLSRSILNWHKKIVSHAPALEPQ